MKKRQKPILLVTLLIIALGGVAFIGGAANPSQPQSQEQSPSETLSKPREGTTDPKKVGADTASKVSSSDLPKGPRPMMKGDMADEPVVKKAKYKPSKPVPNDTSIASQWYTPDANGGKAGGGK